MLWSLRPLGGRSGRVGPERPHARPGPTGGDRVAGALEDVEKVLIRWDCPKDRVGGVVIRKAGAVALAGKDHA